MQHNSSSHELSDSIVSSNFKISFTDRRGRDALHVPQVVQGMSPPIETFYHKKNSYLSAIYKKILIICYPESQACLAAISYPKLIAVKGKYY